MRLPAYSGAVWFQQLTAIAQVPSRVNIWRPRPTYSQLYLPFRVYRFRLFSFPRPGRVLRALRCVCFRFLSTTLLVYHGWHGIPNPRNKKQAIQRRKQKNKRRSDGEALVKEKAIRRRSACKRKGDQTANKISDGDYNRYFRQHPAGGPSGRSDVLVTNFWANRD